MLFLLLSRCNEVSQLYGLMSLFFSFILDTSMRHMHQRDHYSTICIVFPESLWMGSFFAFHLLLLHITQIQAKYHWLIVGHCRWSTGPHLENKRWILEVWHLHCHECSSARVCSVQADISAVQSNFQLCKAIRYASRHWHDQFSHITPACLSNSRNQLAALFPSSMRWRKPCAALTIPRPHPFLQLPNSSDAQPELWSKHWCPQHQELYPSTMGRSVSILVRNWMHFQP